MYFNYQGHSKKSGIYNIVNKINGKVYVGSCKEFKERGTQHLKSLEKQKHHNKHLQASFNKYGQDAFIFEVIEIIDGDTQVRRKREQEILNNFIQENKWEQCFNLSKKTIQKQGPWSVTPEETRKKASESMKKAWSQPGYREKIIKLMKESYTEEVRKEKSERLSGKNNPMFGKPVTKETKEKISKSSKEIWNSQEHRNKMKEILSENAKKQWKNNDYRNKMINKIKEIKNTLENKQRQSELAKNQWANAEIKEKMVSALNRTEVKNKQSRTSKKLWQDPSHREKMSKITSENAKKQWNDPAIGEKMRQSLKGINAKTYKFLTPNKEMVTIINLTKFCLLNNLSYSSMSRVVNGKQNSHKGWCLSH